MIRRTLITAALLLAPVPLVAQQNPLKTEVEMLLAQSGPGLRYGLLVVDEEGREIVAIRPDERFIPASNTKLFTTAAAYARQAALDAQAGTSVRIEDGDVILSGAGDAWLSSAPDCVASCLATLADAVATRTRRVRDVVGDDTRFPDERWSQGMSWNNIPSRSGTASSALSLDDNELAMTVTPAAIGAPPTVTLAHYRVDNRALTIAGSADTLAWDRAPNSDIVRLTGTIGVDAKPSVSRLGIDDPALHAAEMLRSMLVARGVAVTGRAITRHRPLAPADDPAKRKGTPAARPPQPPALATVPLPALTEGVPRINKPSQNLHAELLLRRVALAEGSGSVADGLAAERATFTQAGLPPTGFAFSDGSGMSTYNRVSPRGTVTLIRWARTQPWGAAWIDSLPIAGTDGTLARRFVGTPLQGKLFAKTGTLNATNALAGTMTAASGRTLTFAAYANDVPDGVTATAALDRALVAIAAAH